MRNVLLYTLLLALLTGCASGGGTVAGDGRPPIDPSADAEQAAGRPGEVDDGTYARSIVVARVNGTDITMQALVRMMNRMGARQENAEGNIDELRNAALDRLVLQELAYQEAVRQGLHADGAAVDAALANVRANVGGDEGIQAFLQQEKLSEEELRSLVERSLTIEHVFAKEVYQKVVVPEKKVREAYEQEKKNYVLPESATLIDVFFTNSENGRIDLAKHAAGVRRQILRSRDKDPWQLTLDGTFIIRNYHPIAGKDPELLAAARKMKKGQLSPVLLAKDGPHIVKLKEYAPQRQMTFNEVRPRLENRFRVPAQDARLKEWEQELRRNAVVEIIPDSPSTAAAR